mgnify:CR=1 FL=1
MILFSFNPLDTIDSDSAIVKINAYRITLGKIYASDSLKNCFSRNEIKARYDVFYHFDFYVKDSVIIKQTIYSNDLGYVPSLFKIKVNSNLEIKALAVD